MAETTGRVNNQGGLQVAEGIYYQVALKPVIYMVAAGFSLRLHGRNACATASYPFDGNLGP